MQNAIGNAINNMQAMDEDDVTHAKMMEFDSLLETSGEHNLRSIGLTHRKYPCHCPA